MVSDYPGQRCLKIPLVKAYSADDQTKKDGQIEKEIELLEDAVQPRGREVDDNHFVRFALESELADAYTADGRMDKSLKMTRRLVDEAIRADVHELLLRSLVSLVLIGKSILGGGGQLREALRMPRRISESTSSTHIASLIGPLMAAVSNAGDL